MTMKVIVSAICLLLNKKRIKRFEEQIYCLLPDIVVSVIPILLNLALGNHKGKFEQPKTDKPFDIQDYKMFIPYLDKKKLASHPFIFAPICYADYWWIWMVDVKNKRFHGYVISRMRISAKGQPLTKKDDEIEAPYVHIARQHTSYDCAIYVIKWLEIVEPQNIKKDKYEWENWTQVDYL
ncbi:hypothetical protein Ahy_B07g087185 [Arachis hypogaea]|uniref:Ubiquitin-like protease family profile domain-containing protein n=1 Tax=Arachis hypogaea TaxID=3818 RepID=A0A444YBF2_ARAHY|nr:hypothetical protein Ahy_B07g087185 [Arachis hypogaea]